MRRVGRNAAIAAAAGCCLGALQVVRENRGEWDAVHATLLTIVIQIGAGALVGGAFLAVIMVTLLSRRRPGGLVARPAALDRAQAPVRAAGAARARAPSPVRHVLILVFAVALVACGGAVGLAVLRHPSPYALLRGGAGGALLVGLGVYLIWDDFVAPRMAGRARIRPGPG